MAELYESRHTGVEIDDTIDRAKVGGEIDAILNAAEYSAAQTYALGDYCKHDGKLYRCTTFIAEAEAWNQDHWTETSVTAELEAISTLLQNKPDKNSVVNPNLLDNWYFGNPVNQRNVSGTIDTVGYFLDRWKLVSGSVTIVSNGITLNGTIVQILEAAVGTDVTASALTTEGVVDASYDNNSKTFSLTGTGQTFVAAKLELGSTQTLANQDENGVWQLNEIPDYGEQLRRCQRYYYRDTFSTGMDATGVYSNQNRAVLHFPQTMRTRPSVSVTPAMGYTAPTPVLLSQNEVLLYTASDVNWGLQMLEATADL